MSARRVPHRFSVPEYERMIELGLLTEDDRVELLRGEIVAKMPIGDPHIGCVNRLNRFLQLGARERAIISVQDPIRLADSEPEPDVSLLVPRDDFYASGKAGPADIMLLIEVADASLEDDREVKRPLYAENGIAEFWIVNLVDRCVEVHRQPRPDGTYADTRTIPPGESVEITALPGLTLPVAEIL